ncbi:pyridoxamine 5'-phosphate oxidase family protein [Nocardiopsis sp. N85]|uniref:pyridoxamine 5'-phosphate oxidase family protein n=1 Tax=Nocardiopsis sp. N85 TaxID=3029400 RepID=UPI00237EF80A|nr:pyridoxamine 5'-phosphate oxidase family protein [Nocardiopsis sp. N85]MDE3724170.1 pyridoxamine 5'-phosphate oxidase family protein [Nocardiopsis sp. N85]
MSTFPNPQARSLTSQEPGEWGETLARLTRGTGTAWLTVSRPDGTPHTRPVLAVWVGGQPFLASGEGTAKSRLLAGSPQVSLAFAVEGMDAVVEGVAERVGDRDRLTWVAAAYAERYGWAPEPGEGGLIGAEGAPTAGPPPYLVYTVVPSTVFAFPTGEDGPAPTRWRFDVWP